MSSLTMACSIADRTLKFFQLPLEVRAWQHWGHSCHIISSCASSNPMEKGVHTGTVR